MKKDSLDEEPDHIDETKLRLSSLLLLGVILCQGSLEVKARVFYDVVQE